MSGPELRPVALCPICLFEDVIAPVDGPVPAVCESCRREAEEWSESA
jgi:hypothetical protein